MFYSFYKSIGFIIYSLLHKCRPTIKLIYQIFVYVAYFPIVYLIKCMPTFTFILTLDFGDSLYDVSFAIYMFSIIFSICLVIVVFNFFLFMCVFYLLMFSYCCFTSSLWFCNLHVAIL